MVAWLEDRSSPGTGRSVRDPQLSLGSSILHLQLVLTQLQGPEQGINLGCKVHRVHWGMEKGLIQLLLIL